MQKLLSQSEPCVPQPQVVQIQVEDFLHLVGPSHIQVNRCAGSCSSLTPTSHTCLPTKVVTRQVEVMVVPLTFTPGPVETQCTTVQVEEHLSCSCSCPPRPSLCPPNQWNNDLCSCSCSPQA